MECEVPVMAQPPLAVWLLDFSATESASRREHTHGPGRRRRARGSCVQREVGPQWNSDHPPQAASPPPAENSAWSRAGPAGP